MLSYEEVKEQNGYNTEKIKSCRANKNKTVFKKWFSGKNENKIEMFEKNKKKHKQTASQKGKKTENKNLLLCLKFRKENILLWIFKYEQLASTAS